MKTNLVANLAIVAIGIAAAQESNATPPWPEPISWETLQTFQADSLLTADVLNLAPKCPERTSDMGSKPRGPFFQNILYTDYWWREYDFKGKRCIVRLIPTSDASINRKVDFLEYILSVREAQALLSASQQIGFDDKGLYEIADAANAFIRGYELPECDERVTSAEPLPLFETEEEPRDSVTDFAAETEYPSASLRIKERWALRERLHPDADTAFLATPTANGRLGLSCTKVCLGSADAEICVGSQAGSCRRFSL